MGMASTSFPAMATAIGVLEVRVADFVGDLVLFVAVGVSRGSLITSSIYP